MELAQALVQLWQRKIWVAAGIVVALLAAFGSRELLKSKVYAAATTQMVVDSPQSALGNTAPDLAPFTARAGIYARLMTSPQALDAIGRAAGIPGSQIAAQGPPEVALPQAQATQKAPQSALPNNGFKLLLNQDPNLPTIDVYSKAPTTRQAIALANGAVTGFASYLKTLEAQGSVPPSRRVEIRQLGSAVGGVVDPGTSMKLAGLIAVAVLLIWCGLILYIARMRAAWANRGTASVAPSTGAAHGDHPGRLPAIHPVPEPWRQAENANGDPAQEPDSEPLPDRAAAVAKSPFLRHES
jgi:hypothetical protein